MAHNQSRYQWIAYRHINVVILTRIRAATRVIPREVIGDIMRIIALAITRAAIRAIYGSALWDIWDPLEILNCMGDSKYIISDPKAD